MIVISAVSISLRLYYLREINEVQDHYSMLKYFWKSKFYYKLSYWENMNFFMFITSSFPMSTIDCSRFTYSYSYSFFIFFYPLPIFSFIYYYKFYSLFSDCSPWFAELSLYFLECFNLLFLSVFLLFCNWSFFWPILSPSSISMDSLFFMCSSKKSRLLPKGRLNYAVNFLIISSDFKSQPPFSSVWINSWTF